MAKTTIVVGVDGSENSARALAWCREVAPGLDAEVVAVHAHGLPSYTLPMYDVPAVATHEQEWRDEARRALEEEWIVPLGDVPHRALVVDGTPAHVLMQVADKEDAAMIVVGSRGRGGFAELLLGSVSHQLAHHTTRPLVIVPPEVR
ncbi:MAG TPA: universal stress protein [Acidimicrobiia bacterium]|nr:universal stress protein [Acidimicrobiia bacterium]